MKVQLQFKWFDLWIGLFIDSKNKVLYMCLIPMVVIKIVLPQRHYMIYGKYYKEKPIGCCSELGKEGVFEEEPGCTLVRVKKKKCLVCNEDD